MWRRLAVPVVVSLGVTAALAAAQGSSAPDRATRASGVATVRLPPNGACVHRSLRITVAPPAGGAFASLSVRVGGDEVLQLAGLAGPGSLKAVLPYGRSRVHVSATTAQGEFVAAGRSYRRCTHTKQRRPTPPRPPASTPAPTGSPITGGGED